MPRKQKAKRKTSASKGWHVPKETSEHYTEVKKPFKIKIPIPVILVGFLVFVWFLFLISGTKNNLPDYMTTSQSYQEPIVKESPQESESSNAYNNNNLGYLINLIANDNIWSLWFKILIGIPVIIVVFKIFFRRRWNY
jgi:hypothetical protein